MKLATAAVAEREDVGSTAARGIAGSVGRMRVWPEPRENRLMDIPRIVSAEAVIQGVLKVRWNDDYAAVVDLRPVIARGGLLSSNN